MNKEKWMRCVVLCGCLAASFLLYFQNGLFRQGGWPMVPVLFCSLSGFTVVFGKVKQFVDMRGNAASLIERIFLELERGRVKEAIDICDHAVVPLARVLRAGIIKYDRSRDEIRESMDQALRYERPVFQQSMPVLAALLDILPLLGFLGTFVGIAQIFQVMQVKQSLSLVPGMADVSGGVWKMLLPPLLALTTLIPLYIGYRFLAAQASGLEDEAETAGRELLDFLLERRMS